jgi:peptidyl-prolyl cis-trans isomerase B (cyclophilin B)
VFKGMDVVEAIVAVPTDSSDQPLKPIPLHIDVIQLSREDLQKYGFTPP